MNEGINKAKVFWKELDAEELLDLAVKKAENEKLMADSCKWGKKHAKTQRKFWIINLRIYVPS